LPNTKELNYIICNNYWKSCHWNLSNKSFHPKSYIFHYEDDGEVFIGSSNISRGALTNFIEWNYRLTKGNNEEDFKAFADSFVDLWGNHSYDIDDKVLASYASSWIRPKIYKNMFEGDQSNVVDMIEARGAQIEALYELKKTREEGFDKALVIASTGIGKTYLAAFDSREYEKVLFVALREEIIKQAMASFKIVSHEKTTGLFCSEYKEHDRDAVFAIVNTLGKEEYLNDDFFAKDQFDYIIIDEFHHAAADTYKRVIDYFEPKFLLGLTATPERMDNKDVFELCDYNVAYEIRLKEATNRGELVSFDYYGIHDDTVDYDSIEFKNGRYNDQELEKALQIHKRVDKILLNYKKYRSNKALGFCTSKAHAEYMAKIFNEQGVASAAVYSGDQGEHTQHRDQAINSLRNGDLRVVCSVDMFNEGLDVPSVDLVMFLRPTQSPTIFLQQLGRGLRKSRDKEKLTVVDFIGNYKKANLIPFLLSGKPYSSGDVLNKPVLEFEYPEDCHIDFDLQVIDIFKKLAERDLTIREIIDQEYYRVKELVGKRPNRVEYFVHMDEEVYAIVRRSQNLNPFKGYLEFLKDLEELSQEEIALKDSFAADFTEMVEKTLMSRTYKMPVLLAFYNDGNLKMEINDEDLFESFKKFYSQSSNAVDMLKHSSTKDFKEWGKDKYINLAKRNPVHFLVQTEGNFFHINEKGNMCLNDALRDFSTNEHFLNHFIDAISFRTKEFYKNRLEKKKKELGIE
jgi:superfamily II DNA or RNA helicase